MRTMGSSTVIALVFALYADAAPSSASEARPDEQVFRADVPLDLATKIAAEVARLELSPVSRDVRTEIATLVTTGNGLTGGGLRTFQHLVATHGTAVLPAVEGLLRDRDDRVRGRAIRALREISDSQRGVEAARTLKLLVLRSLTDRSTQNRRLALSAAGQLFLVLAPDERGELANAVADLMADSEEEVLRVRSASVLIKAGYGSMVPDDLAMKTKRTREVRDQE